MLSRPSRDCFLSYMVSHFPPLPCPPLPAFPGRTAPQVDDPFSFICSGCGDCEACSMDDPQTVPACSSAVDHALSQGGHNVTLEWLQIQPGYWRATNNSLAILPCYKAEACNGGITGSEGFCHTGYSGPCEFGAVHCVLQVSSIDTFIILSPAFRSSHVAPSRETQDVFDETPYLVHTTNLFRIFTTSISCQRMANSSSSCSLL